MSEEAKPNVSKEILDRLKSLDNLPHFPEALIKLEKAISDDEDLQIDQIADLVAQDPRMVAGLIELSNSVKYYMGEQVHDISEAITRIGLTDVRNLAHAINFQTSFKRKPPFSDAHYLKHALLSALVAQELAKKLSLDAGIAFLSSLMRDIGIYLLAIDNRDKYLEVIKMTGYDISKLPLAENKVFGTYHPLMSARLLQQWNFPVEVIMGVAFHHAPSKVDEKYQDFAYLTYLAEQGVFRLGFDNGVADITDEERDEPCQSVKDALAYFDLSLEEYDEQIKKALEHSESLGM